MSREKKTVKRVRGPKVGSVEWFLSQGEGKREAKVDAYLFDAYLSDLDDPKFRFANTRVEEIVCRGLVRMVGKFESFGWITTWKPEILLAMEFEIAGMCLEISRKVRRGWEASDSEGIWNQTSARIRERFEACHHYAPDVFELSVQEHLRRVRRRQRR